LTFFSKKLTKIVFFSTKLPLAILLTKNDNFCQFKKKCQVFGNFFTVKCQFSGGSGFNKFRSAWTPHLQLCRTPSHGHTWSRGYADLLCVDDVILCVDDVILVLLFGSVLPLYCERDSSCFVRLFPLIQHYQKIYSRRKLNFASMFCKVEE